MFNYLEFSGLAEKRPFPSPCWQKQSTLPGCNNLEFSGLAEKRPFPFPRAG
ncbi:MAG: hypothetical protein M5U34_29265 [Chloroflexi bacterium]|nr:hypothetical protein [Chloroflexota bacterium]